MRILQINADVNSGSSGRIAEDIGNLLIKSNHESYIAYGRSINPSSSNLIKIGTQKDLVLHVLKSRFFDRHGFGSVGATKEFLKKVEEIRPNLIHLHNIHGYYLNIKELFNFISRKRIPIVWTLHDCWAFTGHCSYFDAVNCYRWQNECHSCPNLKGYPKSWFIDNSKINFRQKKTIFQQVEKMILVSPSAWLIENISSSFLSDRKHMVIHNGIDISRFRPINNGNLKSAHNLTRKYILGVANKWDRRKGIEDFIKLRSLVNPKIDIVLVGLSKELAGKLPSGITGISRTENIEELAEFYSGAEAFINPTYIDNFPSTNLEAMACGTPVITYRTGGSHESVNSTTGAVIEKGNIQELYLAINAVLKKGKMFYSKTCRKHIEINFNKQNKLGEYIGLYSNLLEKSI